MVKKSNTGKRIWVSIVAIALLFIMWIITTYALVFSMLEDENNLFETAYVKIDLNGGKPVFEESEWQMEPGASLKRDFTIDNYSTIPVYYRVYLENLEGGLQEVLTISLYDGDTLLFSCPIQDFNQDHPFIATDIMEPGAHLTLSAVITMDPAASNAYQQSYVAFDMSAQAIQVAHNPDQVFE